MFSQQFQFIFDEIGLKSKSTDGRNEGLLLSHVIFHPVEKTANPVNAEVKETTAPAPTAQPSGDSAKRAEDILKLIRSRQAK